MNFDPWKLFIGLMDFFSILLSGALMTYLLMGKVGPVVLGVRYFKLAGMQAWHGCHCSRASQGWARQLRGAVGDHPAERRSIGSLPFVFARASTEDVLNIRRN